MELLGNLSKNGHRKLAEYNLGLIDSDVELSSSTDGLENEDDYDLYDDILSSSQESQDSQDSQDSQNSEFTTCIKIENVRYSEVSKALKVYKKPKAKRGRPVTKVKNTKCVERKNTSYQIFIQDNFAKVYATNPGLSTQEVMQIVSGMWKTR